MKKCFVCFAALFLFVSCHPQHAVDLTPPDPGELVMHPDPDKVVIEPDESILFKFTPDSDDPEKIEKITFDFGDGSTETKDCTEESVRTHHAYSDPEGVEDGKKKHAYKSHVELNGIRLEKNKLDKEQKKLYYNVKIKQDNQQVLDKKIIVCKTPMTDEVLQYLAIKEIANEIEKGIRKVVVRGKENRIAFSSFKDANFESAKDQRDMRIIQKVIQAIKQAQEETGGEKKYTILERSPQSLVRLAHEAVWTLDQENQSGKLKETNELEYGLRTTYKGPDQPFLYSVELSGMDDMRTAIGSFNSLDSYLAAGKDKADLEKITTLLKEFGNLQKQARSQRPLLFAKFETADFLIVVDRMEYPPVKKTKAIYYDPNYDAMVMKRTAEVKVNARILDKKGSIKWIKDIRGLASDTILPQFDRVTRIAHHGGKKGEKENDGSSIIGEAMGWGISKLKDATGLGSEE